MNGSTAASHLPLSTASAGRCRSADNSALRAAIASVWRKRLDRCSELRGGALPDDERPQIEMQCIGGG
jgi:hypothetical protein